MAEDLAVEYERYLARFAALGQVDVGSFVKHHGRLIKKLAFDEFTVRWREYHEVAEHYLNSVDAGDTMNDIVVKMVRDHAAELLLASPV